jgi:hypothetical protein
MTAERTAEEWGRVAVSLPGWRWMPGMLAMWSLDEDPVMPLRLAEDASSGHPYTDLPVWSGVRSDGEHNDHEIDPKWCWPDPDDRTTAGCLLALLGPGVVVAIGPNGARVGAESVDAEGLPCKVFGKLERTLGRACIAAAEALGRWPNLAESGQKGAE